MTLGKQLLVIVKKFGFVLSNKFRIDPNQMNSVFKRKNLPCFNPKAEIAFYFLGSSKF